MRYFILLAILLVGFSCETSTKQTQPKKNSRKLVLSSYTLSELNEKAYLEVAHWSAFRALYHVMKHLAPNNVQISSDITIENPDSLLTYKRLYTKSSLTLQQNIFVDKDWRSADRASDTVYRITPNEKSQPSYLQWKEELIQGIDYHISIWAYPSGSSLMGFRIASEQDRRFRIHTEEEFHLDSISQFPPVTAVNNSLQWRKITMDFTPQKTDEYSLQLFLPEQGSNTSASSSSILILTPSILVRSKDFSKLSSGSENLFSHSETITSSFYSVYFWLQQMDEELHQLLVENQFPEKLNTPSLRARFLLLQTRIRALKDQLKNQSDIDENTVASEVLTIEKGFSTIIENINTLYQDRLQTLMDKASLQIQNSDTTQHAQLPIP